MEVSTYLGFSGQCEEALKFYEQCLGGKIEALMTYGESPMAAQFPPDWKSKIIHGRLKVGEAVLMAGDAPPDCYQKPNGFSVALGLKDPAEAERIFQALSEGGSVQMPLQKTFWARQFGMAVDRFGTPWMINCE